ncbi:unnamed protein product [Peniophora sp. CBMAI 1063]|nr:unnamed protein product [Peniophora sp. CBMAI 1063]
MRSTSALTVLVALAVGMDASPTGLKREDATPALQAREPQFSLNIPNGIPVSGAFRNGLTVTPKVGGGSIVTGNQNSTLFGQLSSLFPFGFKRDGDVEAIVDVEASHTLEAREPQFSLNIPNSIPVSGAFRNGLTVTPKLGGGSIVTGNRNSTLFGQFGFKREDGEEDVEATQTLEAREPQFSLNIPNSIPVSGAFRNGLTVTPKVGGGSIVTGNRNSTLFGQFGFKREDGEEVEATQTLEAREPQFSLNIPNSIPVSGAFRNGLTVTPKLGGGSIVTGNRNSTLLGQLSSFFPFGLKRDEDGVEQVIEQEIEQLPTPALAAREPQFSLNIPNSIPVSGAFRNGLTVTPKLGGGSIITGNQNSTLFGQLGSIFPFGLKRDE